MSETHKPRTTTEWSGHLREQIESLLLALPEDEALHVIELHRERVEDIRRALRT
jgi:hypothetical protein